MGSRLCKVRILLKTSRNLLSPVWGFLFRAPLGLVFLGLVWFGLAWRGLVWLGFVWSDLAWLGLFCFGLAWLGFASSLHHLRTNVHQKSFL